MCKKLKVIVVQNYVEKSGQNVEKWRKMTIFALLHFPIH